MDIALPYMKQRVGFVLFLKLYLDEVIIKIGKLLKGVLNT